ncbi:riboflavin synthase [Rhodobacteraceae bacterium NNCM2]|nr:riboflavin synthase [Coraliihabitans acroporae]
MFTGIVREIGEVVQIEQSGDTRIRISCTRPVETIEIGASISCSGVCLTVTETGVDGGRTWFDIDASAETRARTTLGDWKTGTRVNIEPALKLGDELGGHIVSGHVDGVGVITAIAPEGGSHRVSIAAPKAMGKFIAPKGSITLDGISLTVNEVADSGETTTFGVNIIPHTWQATNLSAAGVGSRVNLEIDVLARYVARLAEAG